MSESLAGDPFHEGSSKPMQSMQGGMEQPHTQQPLASEAQTNPRAAAGDNIAQSWASTSLQPGHTKTNPTNDKNKAH